jgi:hypothetical protein
MVRPCQRYRNDTAPQPFPGGRNQSAHIDDADFSSLLWPIFLSVESDRMRVRQKEVVPDTVARIRTIMA